jgi:hypothetical protein
MTKVEAHVRFLLAALLVSTALIACEEEPPTPSEPDTPSEPEAPSEPVPEPIPEPELEQPVALWEGGETTREIEGVDARRQGYVLLDLGEAWTPYILTEHDPRTGEHQDNAYRDTYLSLAREEWPDDHHGERAERDKYLELYGILPTLGILRERLRQRMSLACTADLDYSALESFEGFIAYRNNDRAQRDARRFVVLERQVNEMVEEAGVESHEELDEERLSDRERARLRAYRDDVADVEALRAAQARLECTGFFEDKGRYVRGAMDWPTHEALAEFERRHRIYGWGFLGKDTLPMLQLTPAEVEREAIVRVLTERAMHAAAVIEDGSRSMVREGEPRTFEGADGAQHPIPNLEQELREIVIEAFGLQTPESTLAFLDGLGDLPAGEHQMVAFEGPELPEYYGPQMELSAEIDRGDIWYEFPYDEEGRERAQPVQRRPRLTIFTHYRGQKIPLARFGTTVGGWRSELVGETVMWKYKMSEIGPRVWHRIIASPVWLPPESTPARDLLKRNRNWRRDGERYIVNHHETGPSYASAYGLVAAYHQRFQRTEDGIRLGGDEGIRTHGSVDYMSIMRRHSHGCHRLHNHIAVRLMSFVLKHRPHQRRGQQRLSFRRELEHDGETYLMAIDEGGFVFELDEPLRITVHEGRIRGRRRTPITEPMPKWNEEVGAYVMPDGQTVTVDRMGTITPITLPDAGVPDGGVPDGGVSTSELVDLLPM